MSNHNPIPPKLQDEFVGYVSGADDPDAPDGAWFAMLEDASRQFMENHNLRGDENYAAHQYLRLAYPEEA